MGVPPVILEHMMNMLGMRPALDVLRSPEMVEGMQDAVKTILTLDARLQRIEQMLEQLCGNSGIEPPPRRNGYSSLANVFGVASEGNRVVDIGNKDA